MIRRHSFVLLTAILIIVLGISSCMGPFSRLLFGNVAVGGRIPDAAQARALGDAPAINADGSEPNPPTGYHYLSEIVVVETVYSVNLRFAYASSGTSSPQ